MNPARPLTPMHCACLSSTISLAAADKVKAVVVETACVIELPALNGRAKLGDTPLFVLIEMEGE